MIFLKYCGQKFNSTPFLIIFAKEIMEITAQMIADMLGGEVSGNPHEKVSAPSRIEQGKRGDICFLANPKYEHYIYDTKASVLIVNRSFVPKREIPATLILVDDAYASVAKLLDYFNSLRRTKLRGNRFHARYNCFSNNIASSASIGRGTHIFPNVYMGPKVKVGRDCIIYPGVRIYRDCEIGDRCIIHANAVIGSDGFGFAPQPDGSYSKIPQTGKVVIESDVEIGACTTIDRATMGSTIIRRGVKIDNQCMVAHNVEIGPDTVMAAQSGIAGSTKVGARCVIGGKVGIAGHLVIADGTKIAADSGVMGSIKEPGATLMGSPAFDYHQYMRAYALFKNAPLKK